MYRLSLFTLLFFTLSCSYQNTGGQSRIDLLKKSESFVCYNYEYVKKCVEKEECKTDADKLESFLDDLCFKIESLEYTPKVEKGISYYIEVLHRNSFISPIVHEETIVSVVLEDSLLCKTLKNNSFVEKILESKDRCKKEKMDVFLNMIYTKEEINKVREKIK